LSRAQEGGLRRSQFTVVRSPSTVKYMLRVVSCVVRFPSKSNFHPNTMLRTYGQPVDKRKTPAETCKLIAQGVRSRRCEVLDESWEPPRDRKQVFHHRGRSRKPVLTGPFPGGERRGGRGEKILGFHHEEHEKYRGSRHAQAAEPKETVDMKWYGL
jgi:hypothetical protein